MGGFLTRWIKTWLLFFLFIGIIAHLSACGSGGGDVPFVFGDVDAPFGDDELSSCSEDGDCSSASGKYCKNPPDGQCVKCLSNDHCLLEGQTCNTSTNECESIPPTGCTPACLTGQVCDTETHTCRNNNCTEDPTICSSTQKCENSLCVCDPAKTTCVPSTGACQIDFAAAIVLKVDDATGSEPGDEGHYDSPSTCEQYSGAQSSPGPVDPESIGHFLKPPSTNTDLYCCTAAQAEQEAVVGSDSFGNEIYCDKENRHDGALEVAAMRWRPKPQSAKIKLKIDLTDGCRVWLFTDEFPKYYLENSALDASLIVDAGADYQTFPNGIDFETLNPTYPINRLNDPEMLGECTTSTDGNGNLQVVIANLPLRFFVQLFENETRSCLRGACTGKEPFTERYGGLTADAFQIIPGFGSDSLALTTGSDSEEPHVPAHQKTAMTVQGMPLHFDTASNESRMSLVTAFHLPDTFGASRDDNLGTGQLQAQLGSANLTAAISGKVTTQKGCPIKTQADLTTGCDADCGVVVGNGTLELAMRTTFGSMEEDLIVSGTTSDPSQPISAEACLLGKHEGTECQFIGSADLPFAKDTAAGDPIAGTESRFVKAGTTLRVQSASTSTVPVIINVPQEKVGAFRISNFSDLQNKPLVAGGYETIQIQFEPVVNSEDGCAQDGVFVNCEKDLVISSNPSLITIRLKGRAKVPAAEFRLDEIAASTPYAAVGDEPLVPASVGPSVDFKEATVGIETRTRLYKISNTGVRNLAVTNVQAQDAARNFRVGSIYQGPDFENRTWKIGQNPWKVPPSGNNSVFFFLNYGPFGRVTDQSSKQTCGEPSAQPTRCDGSILLVSTAQVGNYSVGLKGKATKDTRAVMELYFQDDERFNAPEIGGVDDNPVDFVGAEEHLYLVREPLADRIFSFRQVPTVPGYKRAVYLRNGASNTQFDNLVLTTLPTLGGEHADRFTFTPSVAATPDSPLTVAPGSIVKIGDMTFPPGGGVSGFQLFRSEFQVIAASAPPSSIETRDPIIGGYFTEQGALDRGNAAGSVNFKIGRAVGAPQGSRALRIHRLFAGFDYKLLSTASLMVSSTTRGIATRAGLLAANQLDRFTEIYTVDSALNFNAENGTVTLNPIFTEVSPLNVASSIPTSSVPGVRLFNGPGSDPTSQYHFQCVNASGQCGFFYIYIGDWVDSTTRVCGGKPPISANPGDNLPPAALDPRIKVEADCMKGLTDPANGLAPATGIYDPVTGEVTFPNIAIRLFSPDTPQAGGENKDLDTTLNIGLTTECVTSELVPDTGVLPSQHLVPPQTLAQSVAFVTDSGFDNPLKKYIGNSCLKNELHGRRLGTVDDTGTLDNDADLEFDQYPAGSFNFDLAAVGKVRVGSMLTNKPYAQADGKMMYIVIKAEAGHRCVDGTWVQDESGCGP